MTTATELIRELRADPDLAAQVRGALLGEDFLGLPALVDRLGHHVARLAEAQARTEERLGRSEELVAGLIEAQARTEASVARLAEAQARTEASVARLAEAQARTEGRLGRTEEVVARLDQAVAGLAEAQARTEVSVARLAQEVAGLALTIGATIEEEAADVLRILLKRQSYETLELRENLALPSDGSGEIDVAARARSPQGTFSFLIEAKARLGPGEVRRLARLLDHSGRQRLEEAGLPGPWLVYAFGLRIAESAMEAARESGVGVLRPSGQVVAPRIVA